MAITADGKTVASASTEGIVILWVAATSRQLALLKEHKGNVPTLAFSPDNKTLASGGWVGTVRFWDVAAGKLKLRFKAAKMVYAVAWSPDGKTLATGDGDGAVKLWDTDAMK